MSIYWYWYLIIPAVLLSFIAQIRVSSVFKKYNKVPAKNGMSASQVARNILDIYELRSVKIEGVQGNLTDHYDPRSKTLRLSDSTRNSNSIAAIGVAAHEAGHAIQDSVNYIPNKIRAALVPIANLGSSAGPYLAMLGLILNYFAEFGIAIAYFGLGLYFFAFLFYLVTLPVEFNASSRAIRILNTDGILAKEELKGAKKVLNAAAMTYVASTLTALLSFLRMLALVSGSRRRN